MTKQTTWDGRDVLLVEVPEGATRFKIIQSHGYFYSPRIEHSIGGVDLPTDGDWRFAFADPLHPTEQEAGEWVGYCKGYGFRNYLKDDYGGGISPFDVWAAYHLKTATESLRSRIQSEGFPQDRTVVLIKK